MSGKSEAEFDEGWKSESFELSTTAFFAAATADLVRGRKTRLTGVFSTDFDLLGENCKISSSVLGFTEIGELRSLILGHVER